MTEQQEPFGDSDRPGGIFRIWESTPELRWLDNQDGLMTLQQRWRHPRSGRQEWRDVPVVVRAPK